MEQSVSFFEGQNVLITGGGGYLGSKLAEKLVVSNANIFLVDIFFNSISENLIKLNNNIIKCQSDLTNSIELNKACKEIQPDYIFHFGALLNRERDFSQYKKLNDINVNGTLNLLEALKNVDYKGFFFSSSSEVYGSKNKSPFDESMITSPASPYSLTKQMAESLIQTFSEIHNKPYTIFRIFNFFGIDMPEFFFINQLIATLNRNEVFEMTADEQIRDFLFVDDLLSVMLIISKSNKGINEIFNVCNGIGIKLNELSLKIASILNKEHLLKLGALPYRENEVWEMVGSNKKLKELYNITSFNSNIFNIIKNSLK